MTRYVAVFLVASVLALAQSPEPPAFEVASVKPNRSGGGSTHSDSDNGRITCVNMSLKRYIARAYGVREDQISAPDWLATERFDLVAKASSSVNSDTLMQMLQTLLAERFKLVVRRESKELPVYALVVAKNGPKLEKARVAEKDCVEPSKDCRFGGPARDGAFI